MPFLVILYDIYSPTDDIDFDEYRLDNNGDNKR